MLGEASTIEAMRKRSIFHQLSTEREGAASRMSPCQFGERAYVLGMSNKLILVGAVALSVFGLASCAVEQERKVVLPQSSESELPWNGLLPGEGQGALGGLQQR